MSLFILQVREAIRSCEECLHRRVVNSVSELSDNLNTEHFNGHHERYALYTYRRVGWFIICAKGETARGVTSSRGFSRRIPGIVGYMCAVQRWTV